MPHIFRPILAGAQLRERLIGCVGAAVCIALTAWLCAQLSLATSDIPAIVAPLGASAVLLFAVPASPLAQPWPVVGGNVISVLVGVTASAAIPDPAIAAGAAVGGAILVMSLLRCLHPPGGAAALTAVIGGPGIHAAGYGFALVPVGINSVALVALAIVFHRTARRAYPHRPAITPPAAATVKTTAGFEARDIDAALADMDESFDIGRADLAALLARAEAHASERRAGRIASGRARENGTAG